MTHNLETDLSRNAWRTVVRRAYGVPDVISDDAAMAHVSLRIGRENFDPPAASGTVRPIVEAVIEQAATGRLDGLFVELPSFDTDALELDVAGQVGVAPQAVVVVVKALEQQVGARLAQLLEHSP